MCFWYLCWISIRCKDLGFFFSCLDWFKSACFKTNIILLWLQLFYNTSSMILTALLNIILAIFDLFWFYKIVKLTISVKNHTGILFCTSLEMYIFLIIIILFHKHKRSLFCVSTSILSISAWDQNVKDLQSHVYFHITHNS